MKIYEHLDKKSATLALWYVVNTSLTAFYKLITHYGDVKSALCQHDDWQTLNIHKAHIARSLDGDDVLAFVAKVENDRQRGIYDTLFVDDESYPHQLLELYDPPPVLFYQGNVKRLSDSQIAIVGSRNPTAHAQKITFDMAQYLAYQGFTVTSGLAIGVDKSAHMGALTAPETGRTVGVMGTGIDVCYPKNHHALYAQIIADGGVLVSELLPATPATQHNFPRRNRLVAGLSLATVVTEATLQSGSLITARLTAEQGKQVFAVPSSIDNANAEGCHHLIREGATLIYHPSQIIEDLQTIMSDDVVKITPPTPNLPASQPKTISTQNQIPTHLQTIFDALTNTPTDLDSLMLVAQTDIGNLLAGLLELEMLGVIHVIGGRYARSP
ncbi:DNA-processing protein DprA [Moraxella oblonga]|uniref:DNA-processing protein DprA n=1 Tax=Moraxella oblonga TaxID=200413 RepID=UPI0008370841|nr:DNA-processing protein DprA [Moraxella oblonga]